ncbi:unnamed protein product [Nippostrongylus brasiliensis]|uniref:Reverse transcriptase domain-containing protein n=1 Tax=Nippostrongylus brasiliensis TaxID=27835 RepID=A0A0N4YSS9_NIPBR|nr:unnamed protein product [Nippostrongylus brasiliensis]
MPNIVVSSISSDEDDTTTDRQTSSDRGSSLQTSEARFIDDCFVITSTQSEINECSRILNQQSQHIKLTRETTSDGWLPYHETNKSDPPD